MCACVERNVFGHTCDKVTVIVLAREYYNNTKKMKGGIGFAKHFRNHTDHLL